MVVKVIPLDILTIPVPFGARFIFVLVTLELIVLDVILILPRLLISRTDKSPAISHVPVVFLQHA